MYFFHSWYGAGLAQGASTSSWTRTAAVVRQEASGSSPGVWGCFVHVNPAVQGPVSPLRSTELWKTTLPQVQLNVSHSSYRAAPGVESGVQEVPQGHLLPRGPHILPLCPASERPGGPMCHPPSALSPQTSALPSFPSIIQLHPSYCTRTSRTFLCLRGSWAISIHHPLPQVRRRAQRWLLYVPSRQDAGAAAMGASVLPVPEKAQAKQSLPCRDYFCPNKNKNVAV